MKTPSKRLEWFLLSVVIGALIISGIHPHDYPTWALEVFPVWIGIPLILYTYSTFPLTRLLCFLLAIHAIILVIGGHYTYAEVPWFNWLRDTYHLSRNHYDRLGHFAQGFVPAILTREILIRKSPLKNSRWLPFVVVCICLAFSACYELFEWATAAVSGQAADAFLGIQGDTFDTQKDMFMALIGATTAILTLPRIHDKQLNNL